MVSPSGKVKRSVCVSARQVDLPLQRACEDGLPVDAISTLHVLWLEWLACVTLWGGEGQHAHVLPVVPVVGGVVGQGQGEACG